MNLILHGHSEQYAVEQLLMSLFPTEKITFVTENFSGDGVISTLSKGRVFLTATAKITLRGTTSHGTRRIELVDETIPKRRQILQQAVYLAAMEHLETPPPWGAVSGVRPTKITTKSMLSGKTIRFCRDLMEKIYFVSPQRTQLCLDCSTATLEAMDLLEPRDISLYVGIPFCPSRCTYCSFVSQTTERQAEMLPAFLEILLEEIAETGKIFAGSNFRIRTVYIGGGTPTTLSADQMGRLMDGLSTHFDLSNVIEYTVEGGRPDTLDLEKLEVIRQKGADRMSINPQTMEDEILKSIGRRHTTAMTVEAYHLAKQAGFEGINMDLIAGLPGDTLEGFARSVNQVLALEPTNITIHTLAVKKGSDLIAQKRKLLSTADMSAMVDYAETALRSAGYAPYYLYRQKYMSGSFENVGWCKPGFVGLYNIYMMEEIHSIVALGGGGMNKINMPNGKIERFHNPKYPKEYMERLPETLKQKEQMLFLMNN
ncbi:MAG: coproporphyrinogen dehydrogenase HemZ [Eubacteriales bacterium]